MHNLDIFDEFQFGIGDEISVYKANMIIPQIADNRTAEQHLYAAHDLPLLWQSRCR
ncbi:MAG: hypothetical protein ACLU3I_06620 [Acutalibacteraceae bacterium]